MAGTAALARWLADDIADADALEQYLDAQLRACRARPTLETDDDDYDTLDARVDAHVARCQTLDAKHGELSLLRNQAHRGGGGAAAKSSTKVRRRRRRTLSPHRRIAAPQQHSGASSPSSRESDADRQLRTIKTNHAREMRALKSKHAHRQSVLSAQLRQARFELAQIRGSDVAEYDRRQRVGASEYGALVGDKTLAQLLAEADQPHSKLRRRGRHQPPRGASNRTRLSRVLDDM